MPARNGLHWWLARRAAARAIHPMSNKATVADGDGIRKARRPGEGAGGTARPLTSALQREPSLSSPGEEVRGCNVAISARTHTLR